MGLYNLLLNFWIAFLHFSNVIKNFTVLNMKLWLNVFTRRLFVEFGYELLNIVLARKN